MLSNGWLSLVARIIMLIIWISGYAWISWTLFVMVGYEKSKPSIVERRRTAGYISTSAGEYCIWLREEYLPGNPRSLTCLKMSNGALRGGKTISNWVL